jgi:hypothetical protein
LTASVAPPSGRGVWFSFAYLATWSYLLYGLGNATPYLRAELNLTDFQTGLHASALAVGVLTAGVSADAVGRRVGSLLLDIAVVGFVVGVALVSLAPSLPFSLAGAFCLGFSGGALGTQVNVNLGEAGGGDSRKVMNQANAVAMVTAGAAPVAMGLAASGLHAWRIALLLPIVAAILLSVFRPRVHEERASVRVRRQPLPRAYWFVWVFMAVATAIEFSFVFWGSTIVARQTGISDGDATLLASLFVAGMFIGRAAIGQGFGSSRSPRALLVAGLMIVLVGAGLVWASTFPAASGLGLFLGGLGTAGLFPIGIAEALQRAGRAQLEGSARATLATGTAVLLAPSALGLASDMVGVVGAWPIILGLALAGIAVLAVTPRTD